MKNPAALVICLLVTLVLAGCHEQDEPENPTVMLSVLDPPETVQTGEAFNLIVEVGVDRTVTSEHSGSHWGFNSSQDLEPTAYTTALTDVSPHILEAHTFPDTYTIEGWTFDEEDAGRTVYYRAHTIIEGEHYWGEEQSFLLE